AVPAPIARMPARRPSPSGRTSPRAFYARLSGAAGERVLALVDVKGRIVTPDFRTFVDAERVLIRAFAAEIKRTAVNWSWDGPSNVSTDGTINNPSEYLVDLAVAAGALADEDLEPLFLVPGNYRCALELDDPRAAKVRVSAVLVHQET